MGGLSLLAPWFLAGAAAVAVPIVLHLLARHTAPEVAFPATRFVPAAPVEQQRRRRVTDLLLLALRCLALLLIALAFARPYLGTEADASAPGRVVVIDTSFSMAAPATWAAAIDAARRAIDEAPAGRPVAVVTLDDSARVVVPLSLDRAAARAAVDAIRPGHGATRYGAMGAAVRDVLAGRAGGEVVLVTDLQRAGLTGNIALPPKVPLAIASVPSARTNLSVSAVERDRGAILATVTNHGLTERSTLVSLLLDDEVAARQPVELEAGASRTVQFAGADRERGIAVVQVDDADGLPADDARTLVLDPLPPTRAWVVKPGEGGALAGFYLERALAAGKGERRVTTTPLTLPRDGFEAALADGPPHVVVVLATRGLGAEARRQLTELVQAGAGLLVAVGPEAEPGAISALLEPAGGAPIEQAEAVPLPTHLVPTDVRHPVLAAYVDRLSALGQVRFDRVVRLRLAKDDRVVARFDNGLPALVERRMGNGRVLLLASDLDGRWNQWPRSATFVPVLHAAVSHLGGVAPAVTSFLVGRAPAEIAQRPGAHVLADGRRVAVNVDPRESSLDLVDAEALRTAVVEETVRERSPATVAAARERSQALWRYAMVGAVILLAAEGLAGARRAAA